MHYVILTRHWIYNESDKRLFCYYRAEKPRKKARYKAPFFFYQLLHVVIIFDIHLACLMNTPAVLLVMIRVKRFRLSKFGPHF